jgi:hypothetical protein
METWRQIAIIMAALAPAITIPNTARSQSAAPKAIAIQSGAASTANAQSSASEPPTGFDNQTNGFTEQGTPFEQLTCCAAPVVQ